MNKAIKLFLSFTVLVAIAFSAFYFYRDNVLNLYDSATKGLQSLNKTDFENILNEIKKEVLAPSPLNVGGQANQVVLTKAKVIAETNIQRYNNGLLLPLIENTKLNAAALSKANDMFAKQYFEHVSPSGVGPGDLVKNFGYDYILEGENLILGNFKNEKEVVQLWMDSPGHRANILNKRFTQIGVAIIKGTYHGKTAWIGVQEFGLPMTACDNPNQNLKNQIDSNQANLDALSLQLDQKKAQIDSANRKSDEYSKLVDEYNQLATQYNVLSQETKNIILQYNNQINIFNQCVTGS